MDDKQNLDSQSSKDRPWTTDEIRKHSSNWTLAGDVGLFNLLNEFSHQIISRTHEVENAVDSLVHETKMTTAKINNVINDFHMLSNLQFVENRVYDEEIQEPVTENKPVVEKTKEQREAEMLPKIVQAIELGLAVLDTAFDRINVNEMSDSEDEDISSEGHTILEPKDPYENRPLPYIIGSEEFMKCDYAGLKDLIEDDARSLSEQSSLSESDDTSSDEGEPLPLDDDRFSEKPPDEISQNSYEKKLPKEKMFDNISSGSDESDLFGSEKEVNGFGSQSSLDTKSREKNIQRSPIDVQSEEEIRKPSVSSLQSKLKLPQVLPVPKLQEKNEDDLFAKEDNSDDESPFRKKTGLFASDVKFKDEKDDDLFVGDLFGKSHSEGIKEVKSVEEPKTAPKKPPTSILPEIKKPSLFDNDEDSEDDIFNTLMKTKKPTTTKTNSAESQESPDKADTSSTPSSAPSTKPSGNAFDFVTGAGNGDSLFGDDSDGDDLFSSKKTTGKKFAFDSSENEDLFDTVAPKASKESKVLSENKSLFEDKKSPDEPNKKEAEKIVKQKTKQSLFGDSDSSDLEEQVPVKPPISFPKDSKKGISLFDDEDLEEDIFSKVAKESKQSKPTKMTKPLSLFEDTEEVVDESKPSKRVEKSKTSNLFEDTQQVANESKPSKPVEKVKTSNLFEDMQQVKSKDSMPSKNSKSVEKPKNSSLFSDTEEESSEPLLSAPRAQQSKLPSLFDENESDGFDLFSSKPSVKPTEPVESLPSVNVSSPAKTSSNDSQVSFDTPVDSSNVLNVINKSRVKVTAKRRKPTRQGRLAALENSEKEAQDAPAVVSTKSASDDTLDDSNSLFSIASSTKSTVKSEPPKSDYKSEEKKKMNLMSQLMSEVAVSKIALRRSAEKQTEEEEDEDIDIFSQTTKESKSSFSFKTPEDKGISTLFPIEKKEEKDENTSKSDSIEDDFFTEPAFQNFRSSISHKDPVLDLDDDDDDLFSAIRNNSLPKVKKDSSESNDLFGDDTDIFAGAQKEKYEMFPNQVYDEDDDIFSRASNTPINKSNKTSNSSSIKKVETKPIDAFDDPLTGLLGE